MVNLARVSNAYYGRRDYRGFPRELSNFAPPVFHNQITLRSIFTSLNSFFCLSNSFFVITNRKSLGKNVLFTLNRGVGTVYPTTG